MPQLESNGVNLEYEVRGEGRPILFVMGLAGQLIDWPEEFLDLFVDHGYQVIVYDNRDIGLSTQTDLPPPSRFQQLRSLLTRRPLPETGYTIPDMANDAAGLLTGLGIDAAHVVGISMGGMIAQELAIGHPERVLSMCSIMSNPGDRRSGGISPRLLAKLARTKPPTDRAAAVEASVRMFELISGPHFDPVRHRERAQVAVDRSFTPDGVARQSGAIAASRNRTELLGAVMAPTLVIHGQLDPLVRLSGGLATAAAIPSSRLIVYPDMGHDLPRHRWAEMHSAIATNTQRAHRVPAVDAVR